MMGETNDNEPLTLESLPRDVLTRIFLRISPRLRTLMGATSTTLRDAARDPPLWRAYGGFDQFQQRMKTRGAMTRVVRLLKAFAGPVRCSHLRLGLTKTEISSLETKFSVSLPSQLIELYRIHDGEEDQTWGGAVFDGILGNNLRLLPLEEALDERAKLGYSLLPLSSQPGFQQLMVSLHDGTVQLVSSRFGSALSGKSLVDFLQSLIE